MKARIETRTLGAILCAAVVALAISQAGASAGTQQENIPFSGVLFNPCNGEQVAAEGSFHNVTRVDTDASGGSHFFFHQNAHLSGIGLTTGARYTLATTTHEFSYNQPFTTVQAANVPFQFVAQGNIPNFEAVFQFHITINHEGVVTAEIANIEESCQGD